MTSATPNRRRQDAKKPADPATERIPQLCKGNTPPVPEWNSIDLFKGSKEISIQHNGADYRLRITAANKLILTK